MKWAPGISRKITSDRKTLEMPPEELAEYYLKLTGYQYS